MVIKNKKELLSHGEVETREKVLEILEEGLKAADPEIAIKRNVVLRNSTAVFGGKVEVDLSQFENIVVVGAGKASGGMTQAIEEIFGDRLTCGVVIVPRGIASKYVCKKIKLIEADHPVPTEKNIMAAEEVVSIIEKYSRENTLFICLISGGGSALLTMPRRGLSIEDVQELTKLLLKCGADITEVNTVRKHLSEVKGGLLAKKAYPSRVISLIISDVVGDPVEYIASGPTAPDSSTFRDAVEILKRYNVWDKISDKTRSILLKGCRGEIPETPKPGDPIFARVSNIIIASNKLSLEAMKEKCLVLGLKPAILTSFLEGEARHVGKVLASITKEVALHGSLVKPPCALLAGGETTVTVKGRGRGGRNQELVLGFALTVSGFRKIAFASIGSDGIDGVTDAAGAICDGNTIERGKLLGLDPYAFLEDNNTYEYFKKLDDLIFTGPTGTNVNDLSVAVIL